MKPYNQLTNQGKLRRLKRLAFYGLSHYDLKDPTLRFHGFETNLLYRVTSAAGEKFILRLAYPGWRSIEDLLSEALWLNALRQDTNIPVPAVLPTRSGEHVLSIKTPDVPDIWHMTLMRWLPGRLLGNYLTETNLEKMGGLFSALHDHGARWTPPARFTKRRFDYWLSRGEANLVSKVIANSFDGAESVNKIRLGSAQRQLLHRMDQHVGSAYQAIDPSDLRVIHCDLWHDNIKLHHGKLYPFDFEDTVWGYRAHDIAMAMLDLLETVGEERYPALLAAFKRGYQTHMAWPEERIEPFQIGRLLWKINWVARFQPQYLMITIEKHLTVFDTYEQTGRVTLPV